MSSQPGADQSHQRRHPAILRSPAGDYGIGLVVGDFDPLFLSFQPAVAGRYSLERELGRGGMGIVYLACEVRFDRPVAIKLLPPGAAAATVTRERRPVRHRAFG